MLCVTPPYETNLIFGEKTAKNPLRSRYAFPFFADSFVAHYFVGRVAGFRLGVMAQMQENCTVEQEKKAPTSSFKLKLLVSIIAILPNCRLENKLIELALTNFSLEEVKRAAGIELEFKGCGSSCGSIAACGSSCGSSTRSRRKRALLPIV